MSFEASHVEFLKSNEMKNVINNPLAAIELKNVSIEDGGGVQLNSHSSFGEIHKLKAPYEVEHPALMKIFDIKFKVPLHTEVTVEAKVIECKEEFSKIKKKKVFNYSIVDTHVMNLSSFFKLAVEVNKSYSFHSVVVDVYENERLLKFDVTSSFAPSLKVFKQKTPLMNTTKTVRVNTLKENEKEDVSSSCTSCRTPVDTDEDGYYECTCGACGTIERSTQDKSFTLSVTVPATGEEMLVQLSEGIFNQFVSSKKEVVTNNWDVTYNKLTQEIESLVKVPK